MKKDNDNVEKDDLRPEYDASVLEDSVRGKYLERYRRGTNLAQLAPEVRAAFPTDDSVNQALESLMRRNPALFSAGAEPSAHSSLVPPRLPA